ncbi:hypothetical protein MARPO_1380s0001 [Marchantia polymorpha]|uniref:BTB domain-containing protein n=1 Tax=Marchantia polymorpha TaxID=3197 RepID=A0A2R6VY05_MARPO|nr:hypothetical protein MARPO_1380s0001 [Marchantia polymorpha]|eukprot:PTQ26491.1 hypothetical protein MARPO_1380s0001 [Marchantia polymorpha]
MNSDRLMDDFLPPIARNYRVERSARFDEDGDVLRESTKLGCYFDMLKMLNNPDSSDMTFMCQDGVKVYACRLLLVSRSSVLRNMLTNGMAESQQSEVVLHEITSPVLLLILEYIYTGWIMLQSFERRAKVYLSGTPEACRKMMLETIRGARFFLLQTVEDLIIQHLVCIVKRIVGYITQGLSIFRQYAALEREPHYKFVFLMFIVTLNVLSLTIPFYVNIHIAHTLVLHIFSSWIIN